MRQISTSSRNLCARRGLYSRFLQAGSLPQSSERPDRVTNEDSSDPVCPDLKSSSSGLNLSSPVGQPKVLLHSHVVYPLSVRRVRVGQCLLRPIARDLCCD